MTLSVVFVIVGVCLFVGSLLIASRANRGVRMPFWKNPRNNRGLAYRVLGAGLTVFGAGTLGPHLSPWSVSLLIFVLLSLPLVIIPVHNHHVITEHPPEFN